MIEEVRRAPAPASRNRPADNQSGIALKTNNTKHNLNMKKVIIALVLLELLLLLTGCRSQQPAIPARDAQASWSAFCAARGYDPQDRNRETYDQYLDTWLGSVEEEQALTNKTK